MRIGINFYANAQGLHDLTPTYVKSQELIFVFSAERKIFLFILDPFPFFQGLWN